MIQLFYGDCLEVMPALAAASVDLVLCDLPYGTTACKWDAVIPFADLWASYNRLVRGPSAPVVLHCAQPFTSALVMSNAKAFKYAWTWRKSHPSGHLNAKKQPMRATEDIAVFYGTQCTYNPQGLVAGAFNNNRPWRAKGKTGDRIHGQETEIGVSGFTGYPHTVLEYANPNNGLVHPTQKPVALMEYLIRTYTNPGDTVLDNCMGSGTTGVACINTGRSFIGIEKEKEYFDTAQQRLGEAQRDADLALFGES